MAILVSMSPLQLWCHVKPNHIILESYDTGIEDMQGRLSGALGKGSGAEAIACTSEVSDNQGHTREGEVCRYGAKLPDHRRMQDRHGA